MTMPTAVPPFRVGATGRMTVVAVRGLAWLLCRLPDAPLHRLFALFGEAHYRFAGRRRGLARRNLLRVCRDLVQRGLASPRVAEAARDKQALERLVQEVFRHHARYYLEVMRVASYSAAYLAQHLAVDDPGLLDEALDTREQGVIFVGLHFGAMELPVRLAALRLHAPVLVPTEALPDPAMQAWFRRQRSAAGAELIDPYGAGRRLVERARSGGAVAIVGDRPIGGPGRPAPLFGAQALLPVGPALVAIQAGVPTWATAVRRTGPGRYALRLVPIAAPASGPLKVRVAAFQAALLAAFDVLIADAPEQWWTLLFPIWEDGT
jgi:KDO2-lipid IV(A) lauroyltransferase